MNVDDLSPRRRDELSDWHDLVSATCQDCGCTYFQAKDDTEVIWEPGRAWARDCRDRGCHCHVAPVIGARRP